MCSGYMLEYYKNIDSQHNLDCSETYFGKYYQNYYNINEQLSVSIPDISEKYSQREYIQKAFAEKGLGKITNFKYSKFNRRVWRNLGKNGLY